MGYYEVRRNAARDIHTWIRSGENGWPEFQKALLLKYGLGKTITQKIRKELE